MPIVVSCLIVFSLFFAGMVGLSWLMVNRDFHMIVGIIFLAVGLGTFIAVIFHFIQQRRQSRFIPILLRKNKN
jgi:Na+(H+)/acetate symporter ActP